MRIKELREEKQISQKVLAEAVNTSQRNIGRWENGENEPSYVQLIKLADFFNCSIDYLVGREDDFGNVGDVSGNNLKYADNELTKDEETLLRCFQKCGPFEREAILIQIRALAGEKKEVIKK